MTVGDLSVLWALGGRLYGVFDGLVAALGQSRLRDAVALLPSLLREVG